MYVTDTHGFVYYSLKKKGRLGPKARRLYERAEAGKSLIYVPSIVLWEVALLAVEGDVEIPERFDHWCRRVEGSSGFAIQALEWMDVDGARGLPFPDPYDCLIAGTALRLAMPLITKDETICDSGLLDVVW